MKLATIFFFQVCCIFIVFPPDFQSLNTGLRDLLKRHLINLLAMAQQASIIYRYETQMSQHIRKQDKYQKKKKKVSIIWPVHNVNN